MRLFNGAMIAIIFSLSSAYAGNEIGNGGDTYAMEFIEIGRSIVSNLKQKPNPLIPQISELEEAVESTSVVTKDSLGLQGVPVDAINYPESKRIELNRSRWSRYDRTEKTNLVLHEYLGVAKVDDTNYKLSGSYARQSNKSNQEIENVLPSKTSYFVGVGSSLNTFTGNMGKLYKSLAPAMGVSFGVSPLEHFAFSASFQSAEYFFRAQPNGTVNPKVHQLELNSEYHFLGTGNWLGKGEIDPYLLFGLSRVWRSQAFVDLNQVAKDSANGIQAGGGVKYFVAPKRFAIAMDYKIATIFFADRNSDEYSQSGVPNTTGFLVTAGLGVHYYF